MTPAEKQALIELVQGRLRSAEPPAVQIVRDESPLGAYVQANPRNEPTTIIVSPNKGLYEVCGVRSFNAPGTVEILRISGPDDVPQNAASFDSAAYALEPAPDDAPDLDRVRGYFKARWGTISQSHPLTVTYAAMGFQSELPWLNWVLFGRYVTEHRPSSNLPKEVVEAVIDEILAETPTPPSEKATEPVATVTALPPKAAHPWGIPQREPLGTMMRRRAR